MIEWKNGERKEKNTPASLNLRTSHNSHGHDEKEGGEKTELSI